MTLGTILLVILILMLIGAIPTWPHSRMGLFPQWYPWDSVADLAHSDAVGSNIVPAFDCVESIKSK